VLNQTFDELATARVNVLKFWAFQSFAGNTGLDFTRFDQMIAAARRAGIRLIPVLENHWADCTSGGEKNDAWFSSGYKLPYGNYALSYREYVRAILRRYRDEPTLLAWELFHEAHGTDSAALQAFFEDMTQVVRMDAPNHLIIAGLDNGDSPATRIDGSPSSFKQLNSLSTVDLIDLHDFEQPSTPLPNHFTNLLLLATELKKPVFIGAAAVTLEASTESAFVKRANVLASKIEATQDAGSVGFLIYDYNPNWTELRWSFDGREGEPLAGENGVLARFSPGNP
jgi:endo-1,4-beta-mannosidase